MKVLFCKTAYMKYYKGVVPGKDEPVNGGSYIAKYRNGGEVHNFDAIKMDDEYVCCTGFVETKQTYTGKINQLHIEKLWTVHN